MRNRRTLSFYTKTEIKSIEKSLLFNPRFSATS